VNALSAVKRLFLGLVLCVSVAACSLFGLGSGASAPGLPPDASAAQVNADEVVQGLADAWNAAVPVCLGAEKAGAFPAGSCAKVLLPAHDALLAAGAGIDAWNQGQQGNFACAVGEVAVGLGDVAKLLESVNVAVPPPIPAGLAMAEGLAGYCPAPKAPPLDGGAG